MENYKYKLPLRNKDKEIIDYCLVSEEDYETLNQFRWYKTGDGYVLNSSTKIKRIHRYIMIEILKNDIDPHTFIDHINNNPLDNRRENLRIVTHSENARNRKKEETKKYYGVSFDNKRNLFRVRLKINKETAELNAYYENEEFAAYQYNIWIKKHKIKCANLNNIKKPKDFIKYIPKKKNENLPVGVSRDRHNENRYVVIFNKKHIGIFNSIEEASNKYQNLLKEYNENKLNKILNEPIKINKKGECIIELFNKKKEKVAETIVDNEDYYKLKQFSWWLTNVGYVSAHINNKVTSLHRYLMKYDGKNVIDHINNDPLDNRKCNLRIVTKKQNSMNSSSQKNATSKYIGVSWAKNVNKWSCQININGNKIHLGVFEDEIEAGKRRDIATKEFFGEHGKLNFPEL